jgi:hypothetical protein
MNKTMPKLSFKMLIPYLAIFIALFVYQLALPTASPADTIDSSTQTYMDKCPADGVAKRLLLFLQRERPEIPPTPEVQEKLNQYLNICADTRMHEKEKTQAIKAWNAQYHLYKWPESAISERLEMIPNNHSDISPKEIKRLRQSMEICVDRPKELADLGALLADAKQNPNKYNPAYLDNVKKKQDTYFSKKEVIDAFDAHTARQLALSKQIKMEDLEELNARINAMPFQNETVVQKTEKERFAAEERHRQWERRRAEELDFQRSQDKYDQEMWDYLKRPQNNPWLDEIMKPSPPSKPLFTPGVPPTPAAIPAPPGCRNVNVNGEWFQVC